MRILGYILVVLFVTTSAMGQQINPVPDYIFRNQMSVGRNAPTDTAAYLSVGPRYGANKGLMPPMVVDTNAVTGVKRNGLLIFSVQLNNFAYWDSTTSRFRKITAEAVVDSVVFATRAWRKKGDDSLGAVISQRTDTALLSTRAYRQKGVDSLVTLISTLGGGTVLSVSAGTGMNFTTITTSGSVSADTSVLSTRAWRKKGDDSLGAVIAGKVNISDTSTMLSAYLRKADTTSMLSPYLRKTDTTAMLTPYVRTAGFGLTKGTQALSVDSALMATRARVQKGIDSVASLVTTTDSVVFSTRAWRQKGVDSVAALANTKATATGTTNYLSKFTGTSSLGNSIVYATTSEVGISTPSPTHPLDVNGRVRVRTIDSTSTGMNMLYADNDGVIKKAAIPAGGSGTVTSVSAGTGMSFTTITTTGAVSADTVALSTRAWRQKGIDSVAAIANAKVNISDTATMLTPYNRGSGTLNYIPKYLDNGRRLGNSLLVDDGRNVGIGLVPTTTTIGNSLEIANGPLIMGLSNAGRNTIITNNGRFESGWKYVTSSAASQIIMDKDGFINFANAVAGTPGNAITWADNARMFSTGNSNFGGLTDAGYKVDVQGTFRNTTGANLATSSGNVVVGGTGTGSYKVDVTGDISASTDIYIGNNRAIYNGGRLFLNMGTSGKARMFSQGDSTNIQFYPNNQMGMYLNYANELFINYASDSNVADSGDFKLQVNGNALINGRVEINTIDSTASAINMLYADASGVIKKTAVPAASTDSVKMRTATITAGSGFTLAKEAATGTSINQVVGFVDASGLTTVKLNGAVYKTTNTFTTGSWVTIATIAEYRPNNDVYFSLPNLVSGESFESTGNVDFTAAAAYSGATSLRVKVNGDIQAYVGTVDASADLSGANYVILPIVVSYPILTLTN